MSDSEKHGKAAKAGAREELVSVHEHAEEFERHSNAGATDRGGKESEGDYFPPNGLWPLVIISGRYGYVGCQNKQTLRYNNITRRTALNDANEYFGLCPKIINYYDEQGHLIETESP